MTFTTPLVLSLVWPDPLLVSCFHKYDTGKGSGYVRLFGASTVFLTVKSDTPFATPFSACDILASFVYSSLF